MRYAPHPSPFGDTKPPKLPLAAIRREKPPGGKASPCFILLTQNSAKFVSLVPRLPPRGKLCRTAAVMRGKRFTFKSIFFQSTLNFKLNSQQREKYVKFAAFAYFRSHAVAEFVLFKHRFHNRKS